MQVFWMKTELKTKELINPLWSCLVRWSFSVQIFLYGLICLQLDIDLNHLHSVYPNFMNITTEFICENLFIWVVEIICFWTWIETKTFQLFCFILLFTTLYLWYTNSIHCHAYCICPPPPPPLFNRLRKERMVVRSVAILELYCLI